MLVYGLLIPLTVVDGIAMGFFSVKISQSQNWLLFVILIGINIVPLWALISHYSKNLIFDELLFNIAIMSAYLITVLILDSQESFTFINWLGLFLAFSGFILLKIKFRASKSSK